MNTEEDNNTNPEEEEVIDDEWEAIEFISKMFPIAVKESWGQKIS